MSSRFRSFIITVALIVGLGAAIWFGLKWFGGVANDNYGDYDGGKGKAEEIVDNQLNG